MSHGGSYLRRCHVCGATIEKESHSIDQCVHCGKHIAPFYYFDERQIIGFGDGVEEHVLVGDESTTYLPLIGVGLYWEGENKIPLSNC
ncbi:MAG: hypothetical protein RJB66_342 [Pseudomonadota bacterium]|jgi:hypothetical protein